MTVIGALSSFRKRGEMSPHKRAWSYAFFRPSDRGIVARWRSYQMPIPIQRARQLPDCGRLTQQLALRATRAGIGLRHPIFGHMSNIAQRQRARKKIVIAWALQDEASGQVGIQEEQS
jgi:hypothetical protein